MFAGNSVHKNPRITILLGEFGSGKTELAINYTLWLKKHGTHTAIVDIDLVKPYFRTRENRNLLEKNGVVVIAPEEKFAQSDLPIMPAALSQYIFDNQYRVVIDVGGGDSAVVLGQLNQQITEQSYEALLVINSCRPFTQTAEETAIVLRRIEQKSRLKISGLVSNTNLAQETTIHHIRNGIKMIDKISQMTDLPVRWVVIPEWLEGQEISTKHPIFVLKRYIQYPWMG